MYGGNGNVRRVRACDLRNGTFGEERRRQGADQHPVVSYDPADAGAESCVVREDPAEP